MCDDTPRADDPPSRVPIVRARLRARGQPKPRVRPDRPTPPRPQAACPPPELLRRGLLASGAWAGRRRAAGVVVRDRGRRSLLDHECANPAVGEDLQGMAVVMRQRLTPQSLAYSIDCRADIGYRADRRHSTVPNNSLAHPPSLRSPWRRPAAWPRRPVARAPSRKQSGGRYPPPAGRRRCPRARDW